MNSVYVGYMMLLFINAALQKSHVLMFYTFWDKFAKFGENP